jgi:hypothetical protein
MMNVVEELGKPSKVHKFPDGFIAVVYFKENYNLIFEANPTRNDMIWAIQVSGR